jgi:hypothetical protein
MRDLSNCVVYDVEIAKNVDDVPGRWDNPEDMGFASAVTYDYAKDQYFFFLGEEQKNDLLRLLKNRTAITFNGIKFDSRVLLGNDRALGNWGTVINNSNTFWWENYDILLEYIKSRFGYDSVAEAEQRLGDKAIHDGSFSLDGLAEGTFGLHKTGHGAKAPILYQQGKYGELLEYNLQDVRLTKKLFEFIREYGFVVDRNGRVIRISRP